MGGAGGTLSSMRIEGGEGASCLVRVDIKEAPGLATRAWCATWE
jgi:hypothetical protein